MNLLGHAASEVNDLNKPSENVQAIRAKRKVGKPYQINGIWYYPKEEPNYNETGLAPGTGNPFMGGKLPMVKLTT
ncbi:hypothetical protein [Sneathiella glossodoripedis]|uniref:hypothetical protein n=1 Tax=Sneathiella glossodoripedis TaxID=418853 RepID=UPI000685A01B|nr:hypothetical protein [Sneathiella glossodoripedis]